MLIMFIIDTLKAAFFKVTYFINSATLWALILLHVFMAQENISDWSNSIGGEVGQSRDWAGH